MGYDNFAFISPIYEVSIILISGAKLLGPECSVKDVCNSTHYLHSNEMLVRVDHNTVKIKKSYMIFAGLGIYVRLKFKTSVILMIFPSLELT